MLGSNTTYVRIKFIVVCLTCLKSKVEFQ